MINGGFIIFVSILIKAIWFFFFLRLCHQVYIFFFCVIYYLFTPFFDILLRFILSIIYLRISFISKASVRKTFVFVTAYIVTWVNHSVFYLHQLFVDNYKFDRISITVKNNINMFRLIVFLCFLHLSGKVFYYENFISYYFY